MKYQLTLLGRNLAEVPIFAKEVECFDKARRNNGFERAFETSIDSDI